MPDASTPTVSAWRTLQRELDLWANSGNIATFWWRDDDAVSESAQLHRLDALSCELGVPVAIAVIPAKLDDSLQHFLRDRDNFTVLQHGYSHTSYAAKGVKKIEVGGERSVGAITDELTFGRRVLGSSFGHRFLPVLVPPWNRIEVRTYDALVGAGFVGVSSMWARVKAYPADGLFQVNAHLDPVNWSRGSGFVGCYRAIAQINQHLYARRTGRRDAAEPTGILTHHRVQNNEVWAFCRMLLQVLSRHPAVHWLDTKTIWRGSCTAPGGDLACAVVAAIGTQSETNDG